MSGNRSVALFIVAIIHVLIGYVLITGLAYKAAKQVIERVTTVDIEEPPPEDLEDEPPPPEQQDVVPPPVAKPPPSNIARAQPQIRTNTAYRPPAPPRLVVPRPGQTHAPSDRQGDGEGKIVAVRVKRDGVV